MSAKIEQVFSGASQPGGPTPGPWEVYVPGDGEHGALVKARFMKDDSRYTVFVAQCHAGGQDNLANAELIVTAVNCHDDLLAALKRAEQFIENGVEFGYIRLPTAPDTALETLPAIKAAISKATAQ